MPPSRKSSRKASRKSSRKSGRKSRRCYTRKNRSARKQSGGANESLAQGSDFLSRHTRQHGGALLTGAPVGYTGMLPSELRMVARVGGLDDSISAAATQRDPDQMPLASASASAQKGGRRKSKAAKSGRKSKAAKSKAAKSSRKSSRKSNKSRKQAGGFRQIEGAPYGQSPMLLSASQAAKAGTADFSNPLLKH